MISRERSRTCVYVLKEVVRVYGMQGVAWVYGLQALIVVPWFLGAVYRKEQSLWAWEEYRYAAARHGTDDSLLGVYLYAILYALLFVSAFLVMRAVPRTRNLPGAILVIIGVWATVTFLFSSCAEFVRNIPDTWNGWLLIFWCAGTGVPTWLLWPILTSKQQE
jgi:hypothetical protein